MVRPCQAAHLPLPALQAIALLLLRLLLLILPLQHPVLTGLSLYSPRHGSQPNTHRLLHGLHALLEGRLGKLQGRSICLHLQAGRQW